MKAVILAGGKGTRLAPYTTVFPKPLMPLGDKPILETIIRQLKHYGFKEIVFAVGYLAELIRAYFGDGSAFGLRILYSKEEIPLGTAGPLSLISGLEEDFLVMNGDILSSISYSELLKTHKKNNAAATIAVNRRVMNVDYGVIKYDDKGILQDYIEKPKLDYDVSMGIYVFNPKALKFIPKNEKLDFPDLMKTLVRSGEKVFCYKSDDYWLDIGRHEDYEKAQAESGGLKSKVFYFE